MSTGATSKSGVAAPSGFTWSEVQNNTGNTTESNASAGYAGTFSSATANFFIADDFTIPAGQTWNVSSVDVFAYQTGYNGATSPFNTMRVNIFSSDPSVAGAVSVFGDDTTNRFASGAQENIYRIFNSTVPVSSTPGTTRRIWKVTGNTPVTLTAGTYWVKYQLQNVNVASAGFFPPVTISGTRGLPEWNAKQYNAVNNTWIPIIDDGNPASAPDYPMDMPFIITYTTGSLGTNEVMQYDNRMQVYPNPVHDVFKIINPQEIKITEVEVIDMAGRIVKTLKGTEEYNISDLSKGNYLLQIKSDGVTKVTNLLKH
ncbi:T9SS type A sorting domain-containing protein [Flavobacterium limi]|uniref:T9SS type A sorting domain-containing protein n=1 Tax=Flavobacterium limi TaxID=2045105 RepID=UPI0013CFB82F|nr:T9SS type A sorting domain-containing protein [Flavobacterium limi]